MPDDHRGRPASQSTESYAGVCGLFVLRILLIAPALVIRTIAALLILPVALRIALLMLLPIMLMLVVSALTGILLLRLVGVVRSLFVTHHFHSLQADYPRTPEVSPEGEVEGRHALHQKPMPTNPRQANLAGDGRSELRRIVQRLRDNGKTNRLMRTR